MWIPPPPHSQHNTTKYKNDPYCFHIISDFISPSNIEKLKILESSLNQKYPCEIKIHIINDSFFRQFKSWGFENTISYATYYRILIDKILPKDINKVLFIDSDMLVLCDIREIFSIDLGDKILASSSGGANTIHWHKVFKSVNGGDDLIVDFKQYFCAGLMLINMQQWRTQNVESKCMQFLQEYKTEFANQDAINYAAQDNIDLGGQWGVLIYHYILKCLQEPQKTRLEYKDILANVKIIHCNGPAKPWSNFYLLADSKIRSLILDSWWDIALQTQGFVDEFIAIKEKLPKEVLQYCFHTMMETFNTSIFNLSTGMHQALQNTHIINQRLEKQERRMNRIFNPHKALINLFRRIFGLKKS